MFAAIVAIADFKSWLFRRRAMRANGLLDAWVYYDVKGAIGAPNYKL